MFVCQVYGEMSDADCFHTAILILCEDIVVHLISFACCVLSDKRYK